MLHSDLVAVILVGGLGLSTGYLGCTALILGGERGASPEEDELLGMVTSFGLMLGLSLGSSAGVALSALAIR